MSYQPQGYPASQHMYPQAQPGYPQPQTQPAHVAPAGPRPNPFTGYPVSDWVRDGSAALLLLVSLALPWSYSFTWDFESDSPLVNAAGRVEVLLITLLSVLSISVGYLAKFGVFGQQVRATTVALVRGLLGLPYLLLVLLYVVFDAVKLGDFGGGLGPAAVVGFSGALLAATPRRSEILSAEFSPSAARHGFAFVVGYFVLGAVLTLLGTVLSLIQVIGNADALGTNGFIVLLQTLSMLSGAAVPLLFTGLVLRRSEISRRVLFGFAIAAVAGSIVSSLAGQGLLETLHADFGYPLLLLGGALGVAGHPGLPYAMRQFASPVESWVRTMRAASLALAIGTGYLTVTAITVIILLQGRGIGLVVGVLVCALLTLVAALILRTQLSPSLAQTRPLVAGIAGGVALAGLVSVILAGIFSGRGLDPSNIDLSALTDSLSGGIGEFAASLLSLFIVFVITWVVVIFFAPVGLIFYGLFVPKEMREFFAAHRAPVQPVAYPQQAAQQAAAYGGQQPAAPAAVDPMLAARAADAQTSPQEQFELSQRPELWVYLAQNPALYRELAVWLASTGDAQVVAVLRQRGLEV